MSDARQVLDNAHGETHERSPALSDLSDEETIRGPQAVGVARWIAGQVGASGLDTRPLESPAEPPLEVCQHDIARDPLPDLAFDLVHAPDPRPPPRACTRPCDDGRRVATGRLAGLRGIRFAVAPADPTLHPAECAPKAQAAMQRVMSARGANRR